MDVALSGTVVHEEHQSLVLMRLLMPILFIGIAVMAFTTRTSDGAVDPAALSALAVVGVSTLAVWYGFGRMTVRVTTSDLRFGYPFWRKRIPLDEVQVGEIVPIRFWYGVGLHLVAGMWVYNAKFGRGVMVTTRGRRYLIGSDNPERLQAALFTVAPRKSAA